MNYCCCPVSRMSQDDSCLNRLQIEGNTWLLSMITNFNFIWGFVPLILPSEPSHSSSIFPEVNRRCKGSWVPGGTALWSATQARGASPSSPDPFDHSSQLLHKADLPPMTERGNMRGERGACNKDFLLRKLFVDPVWSDPRSFSTWSCKRELVSRQWQEAVSTCIRVNMTSPKLVCCAVLPTLRCLFHTRVTLQQSSATIRPVMEKLLQGTFWRYEALTTHQCLCPAISHWAWEVLTEVTSFCEH